MTRKIYIRNLYHFLNECINSKDFLYSNFKELTYDEVYYKELEKILNCEDYDINFLTFKIKDRKYIKSNNLIFLFSLLITYENENVYFDLENKKIEKVKINENQISFKELKDTYKIIEFYTKYPMFKKDILKYSKLLYDLDCVIVEDFT